MERNFNHTVKPDLLDFMQNTDDLLEVFKASNEENKKREAESSKNTNLQDESNPPNKLVKASENTSSKVSDAISSDLGKVVDEVKELTGVDIGVDFGDTFRNLKSTTTKVGADNFSWHKTGRAIDFNQGLKWVIMEDPKGKDMYFRLYLASKEESSKTKYKKNISKDDPAKIHYNSLGSKLYTTTLIDVTQILEDNGFKRIKAHEGWKDSYNKREWWHYEKRDGLNWFSALSQIYTEEEIVDGIKSFATNRVSQANRLHKEGFPADVLKQIWDNKPETVNGLSLYFSVGENMPNIPDDIATMKKAFETLGMEWWPPSVSPERSLKTLLFMNRFRDVNILVELINFFQNANGLPMDGVIKVGGTTHKKLGEKVSKKSKTE